MKEYRLAIVRICYCPCRLNCSVHLLYCNKIGYCARLPIKRKAKDMISRIEYKERKELGEYSMYESRENTFCFELAVPQYRRGDTELQVRDVSMLEQTVHYLLGLKIMNNDYGVYYHFINDRIKAVRKDLVQLNLNCPNILRPIVHFYANATCTLYSMSPIPVDMKLHHEQLSSAILLLGAPNYIALDNYRQIVFPSPLPILELITASTTHHWWHIFSTQLNHIEKCLLLFMIPTIWHQTLLEASKSYLNREPIPIATVQIWLHALDTSMTLTICQAFNIPSTDFIHFDKSQCTKSPLLQFTRTPSISSNITSQQYLTLMVLASSLLTPLLQV